MTTQPSPTSPPAARGPVDALDCRILLLLLHEPGIGVLGASRRLGVARGTVQARLDRLQARGVLRSMAPDVDPAALGYPVTAFCTLEIRQGRGGHSPVVDHLAAIPEVLEAHTITGSGDVLIRIVGKDNADLQRVIDQVVDDTHVTRASTVISLATRLDHRMVPLVAHLLDSVTQRDDGGPQPARPTSGSGPTRAGTSPGGKESASLPSPPGP